MNKFAPHILFRFIFILTSVGSFAQSSSTYCSNTAMVPVFKQDFGTSASPSSSSTAAAGTTNYVFGNVATDGNYIITPKVENANKADWTKGRDHTGNPNGNMFLVNAGGGNSIFVQQTVTGLCAGSSYSFSAWIANVNTSKTINICGGGTVYPKITFNIKDLSNTLLATYTTNLLPLSPVNGPVNWQKYGFQFELPANTGSLKIEIVDAWGGTAACGNDVAMDDILFEACIPQITVALTSGSSDVCKGASSSMTTTLINSPYANPAYQWQKSTDGGTTWDDLGIPGTGITQFSISNAKLLDAGVYRVHVAPTIPSLSNETCSAHSNEITFSVNPLPKLLPSTNAPICSGNPLWFNANPSGGSGVYSSFKWYGPNAYQSTAANNTIIGAKTNASGTYTIQVTDSKGCSDTAALYLNIDSTPVIKMIAAADTICSGNTASVTLNSSVLNSAFYWNAQVQTGNITGNFTSNNPEYSGNKQTIITNNGNSNGEIKYSAYAQSGNCISNTVDTLITVLPKPTIADAGVNIQTCNSSTLNLQANTALVGIGQWRQISGPNTILFQNSYAPNSTITNLIPGTYLLEWSISNNCGSSADTLFINYLAKPNTHFTLTDSIVCGPTLLSFNNNTANKNAYSYQWNFGNGNYTAIADPAPVLFNTASNGVDTSYTITLKALSQCDTVLFSKTIIVKAKPKFQFSATPLNSCLPLHVVFNNYTADTATQFRLVFGDGKDTSIKANDTIQYVYQSNQNSTFKPMLIASNVCGTDSISTNIQAIANMVLVQTDLKDTAVCGTPFTLSFNNNTQGIQQFNWTWGDGTSSSTIGTGNVQHQYLNSGTYTISHTLHTSCFDTTISKTLVIYPSIKASMAALPLSNCIGDTVKINSLSDTTLLHKWKIGNSTIDSLTNFNYSFNQAGNYSISLYTSKINSLLTCYDSTIANISIVAVLPGKGKITPINGTCVPFTVQLINQTQPVSSVTWNMGDGKIAKGDTSSYTFIQSGNYTVVMNAVNAGGCTFKDSTTIQISSPSGTIDFKSGLYCKPSQSIVFSPLVNNTDSIEWNFGDGTILTTTVKTIIHQYTKPGNYKPSFTLISKTGCRIPIAESDSILLESIKANFTVKTIYDCGSTTFNFYDSSVATSGIKSRAWHLGNKLIGNNYSSSATFKLTGTQETNLYVTSNNGCVDSIRGAYNVSIYSFPQVNINSINEACLNSLMELKSDINSVDSILYRIWNLGNGINKTDSLLRILYFDEGIYQVKLIAGTVNRCYDSALKMITIHPVPSIKVANAQRICVGDSIQLRANGANNYVWKDAQDNIICNNCLTVNVRPSRSTQYKVIGYNEYGCTQVAGTNVQVINPPTITVAPESTICAGSSVQIWAAGGATYQWMPALGLSNTNIQSPIVTPPVTTTYKVVARDAYNCFTDTAYTNVIVGKPTPIKLNKDTSFIAGTKIKLQALPSVNNIVKWRWTGGKDLSCVTCPDPVARVVNDETIVCTATNIFGCVTSDTIKINTFCSDAQIFIPNAFSPDGDGINDLFYVQAQGIKVIKNMRIYNRWGELIFEKYNFLPNDRTAGWDGKVRGKLQEPDVFVYICEMICEKNAAQVFKGNVAIIK